jgi:hypothetical protein
MAEFDDVWRRIVTLSGEIFQQKRGNAFTYTVSGNSLKPSTTNRQLPRSHFARAFARRPLDGPGQLQDLQGPSFLFAILTDPRITPDRPLPQHNASGTGHASTAGATDRPDLSRPRSR